MTRWTLVMLQNAQQGLVPVRTLQRFVDPEVLAALGPIPPVQPGTPYQKPRIGRLRVHLVHEGLAHVAAVAPMPEGRPAGYVLEFRRPSTRQPWRITEMTRVEQRNLVRRDDKDLGEARPSRRRLPPDLTALVKATEQVRAAAAAHLQAAESRVAALREKARDATGSSAKKKRRRAALRQQAQAAQADVNRWTKAIRQIDEEQRQLREVADMRAVRQLVVEGHDPLSKARTPAHLHHLLGLMPDDPTRRAAWRRAASAVERYRDTWAVTHPTDALGDLPPEAPPEQRRQRQAVTRLVETYREPRRQQRLRAPDAEVDR